MEKILDLIAKNRSFRRFSQDVRPSKEQLLDMYKEFYKNEKFVRVLDTLPEVKNITGSNYVDIGLTVDERLNRVIVVATIDNLVKGAAGQAMQNMNLLFGFSEYEGLDMPGYYI